MTASKSKTFSKVLRCVAIIAVIYVVASFIATKIIYDFCFERYDPDSSGSIENSIPCSFSCGENTLRGYLVNPEQNEKDAIVVIAAGYRALCSVYSPIIDSFASSGFGVFIFDCTGSAQSEGDSAVGFAQEVLDLDAALTYIEENDSFGYSDILLFGHSRGGLAVCCMERYGHSISAVVSVNGINSPMEGTMLPAVNYVGNFAYSNYPILKLYQVFLFGADIMSYDAAEFLSTTDTPSLIIHSSDDELVSSERFSIISHRDEIQSENVEFEDSFKGSSDGSHLGVLFGEDGCANAELMATVTAFYDRAITD